MAPSPRSRVLWSVAPPAIRAVGRAFYSLQGEFETTLPEPPFVVAANHYSHFDPPAIGAVLRMPIRYLALDDLFGSSRVLEWLVTGFGAIPTPRVRAPIGAVRAALGALAEGEVVAVFPEATRVSHWGTLPPKRGAAWLASRARVPLVPVCVIGTGRVFDLDNHLHRGRIKVVVGAPLDSEGVDSNDLTRVWAAWIGAQIARHPGSEVLGPRRSFADL